MAFRSDKAKIHVGSIMLSRSAIYNRIHIDLFTKKAKNIYFTKIEHECSIHVQYVSKKKVYIPHRNYAVPSIKYCG